MNEQMQKILKSYALKPNIRSRNVLAVTRTKFGRLTEKSLDDFQQSGISIYDSIIAFAVSHLPEDRSYKFWVCHSGQLRIGQAIAQRIF